MNELITISIVLGFMAVGYLLIYPRAKSVTGLRWMDATLGLLTIGAVGAIYFNSGIEFNLLFFKTNWFIFTLILIVILETPLWYFYMKSHPEQGTIAQLYGMASDPKSKKVAKNIDAVMHDTKWDVIRTARAQKILVVLGVASIFGAPALFWFEDFIKPGIGILGVIPIFLIWWLLRISVRLVADAPDEYLDELQLKHRDRTYLHSFRILAALVSALAVGLMIFVISMDYVSIDSVDYYEFSLTFGQVNAVIWAILGSVILVPNLVMAWSQSKGVRV
ncbi:hypothetical protein [Rhodoluna sp. KAS3]|uniref:hypothetical protein n=1 Tax=Rhodoluna sp. KAS3 TaxID=942880 RepID=UPI00222FF4E0|nr:hypothetical protein [Rhodoluna sp. KAS3]BDS49549.1 hypothetical protein RKAS3_11260 [Rhodoluna sp. KAS3]